MIKNFEFEKEKITHTHLIQDLWLFCSDEMKLKRGLETKHFDKNKKL